MLPDYAKRQFSLTLHIFTTIVCVRAQKSLSYLHTFYALSVNVKQRNEIFMPTQISSRNVSLCLEIRVWHRLFQSLMLRHYCFFALALFQYNYVLWLANYSLLLIVIGFLECVEKTSIGVAFLAETETKEIQL